MLKASNQMKFLRKLWNRMKFAVTSENWIGKNESDFNYTDSLRIRSNLRENPCIKSGLLTNWQMIFLQQQTRTMPIVLITTSRTSQWTRAVAQCGGQMLSKTFQTYFFVHFQGKQLRMTEAEWNQMNKENVPNSAPFEYGVFSRLEEFKSKDRYAIVNVLGNKTVQERNERTNEGRNARSHINKHTHSYIHTLKHAHCMQRFGISS